MSSTLTHTMNSIGSVLSCSPGLITVLVKSLEVFEQCKHQLQIGQYLKIAQGNVDFCIVAIRNIRGMLERREDAEHWQFQIDCQPIGGIESDGNFLRGVSLLPVPTEEVFIAEESTIRSLFAGDAQYAYPLGKLSVSRAIPLMVNPDKLFGQHFAIVGSTGSGKSCAVARILQDVIGISEARYKHSGSQNNAHIVLFDLHDEYTSAFALAEEQQFSVNRLDVASLRLPYWLMNAEELESLFMDRNDDSGGVNQAAVFKQAVIANKEQHNPKQVQVTYDSPIYFSIREVLNYIDNLDREVISRLPKENCPKLEDNTLVRERKAHYFEKVHEFIQQSTAKDTKATHGPFHGDFTRLVSRLESRVSDRRLSFMLEPVTPDGSPYTSDKFDDIVRQCVGYSNQSNVTVVDLSGVPFEVLSIVVSVVSRVIFDFCFHHSKICAEQQTRNSVPIMIVCEEAHNYLPNRETAAYRASRKALERIAKEGRKYGLSMVVVSQRPSEVSETIFAQCSNILALRLTSDADQLFIRRMFPENVNGIADALPNLRAGECVVVGDCVLMPAVTQLDMPVPPPQSQSVRTHTEWQNPWKNVEFRKLVKRWRREDQSATE